MSCLRAIVELSLQSCRDPFTQPDGTSLTQVHLRALLPNPASTLPSASEQNAE